MEMSEDSGDLVIRAMDWTVGSAFGCSRNVVNVVTYSYKSLTHYFRVFLINFLEVFRGFEMKCLITPLRLFLGLPFRP
jgi:hypothetical protein